jgi:hypothetical protein
MTGFGRHKDRKEKNNKRQEELIVVVAVVGATGESELGVDG